MTEPFLMNSFVGKRLLALVRDGDYAHAGEEEAIDLTMATLTGDRSRRLLDAGCGRGGTAAYLSERGWGRVTGVDNEKDSIAHARAAYPDVDFATVDIDDLSGRFPTPFDAVTMFNVLYALADHHRALTSLAAVCRPGATLLIFDYVDPGGFRPQALLEDGQPFLPNPIPIAEVQTRLASAGWRLTHLRDIDADYVRWYQKLVGRIEDKRRQMEDLAGPTGFAEVHRLYSGLHDLLTSGRLGGAVITAQLAG